MITLNDTTLLQTNKIRLKNIYVSTYTTQLTLVVLQPCDFYTQKPGYFQHVSHVISQPAREFLQNILIYFQIHLINYLLWHGGLEQIKYDSYASIILTMNLKFQSLLPNVDLMLGQRRRRWANIKLPLGQCSAFLFVLHIKTSMNNNVCLVSNARMQLTHLRFGSPQRDTTSIKLYGLAL